MTDDTAIRYQRMGDSGSSEEDIVSFTGHRNDGILDNGRFIVQKSETPQLHRRKKFTEPSEEGRLQELRRRFEGAEAARRIMAERAINPEPNGKRRRGFNFQDDTNLRNTNRNKRVGGMAEMRRSQSLWSLGHGQEIEEEEGEDQEEEQEVFENNGRPRRPESIEELRMRQKAHMKPNPLHRISSFTLPHQVSYHPMSKYKVASDGQKMVLQLVLPQTGLDHAKNEPPITPDYIHYDLFKPRKGYNGVFESQPDLFPRHVAGPDIEYATNRGHGFSSSEIGIPDRSQLTVTSLGTVSGSLDEGDFPSTTPEEKLKMFRGYLTTILSCVYAVFIVTLGVVIYVSDVVLQNGVPISEFFSIYLVTLGLIYITFLYADIRRHTNKVKSRNAILLKDDNSTKDSSNITCHTAEGNIHLSIPLPSTLALPHHYCFNVGRHSGSFYLKVGAAGFCFGHLIHSGLMLGYQIVYLTSEGEDFYNCASIATLVLDILYPIYSFLQLFFIFKYSNVIINRCKELARFALMHCIASSICFWIWTILRETLDSLNSYASSKSEYTDDDDDDDSSSEHLINSSHIIEDAMALPLTRNQQIGASTLIQCLNNTSFWINNHCKPPAGLSIIANQFSPYLYPFTIEYSILVVGILFIIWQNVGKCKMEHGSKSACPASSVVGTQSNLVIHADCHAANKGLFAGLIVLVGSVVSIIIFCIAMADNDFIMMGLTVNAISELILLLLMTVAVILAYRKLTELDINHHPISLLDDLLLFICIPAFFLYAIFSIVPAVLKSNSLSISITLLQVIQVLLQTPFIIDGLRRCSNTRMLRLKKPGRELVTFLVVCNVAMWITETFEIKSHDRRDDRYDVYGKVLWTMLSHMTVPLTMFYRFHSSVCLVDIWKSAYERGE